MPSSRHACKGSALITVVLLSAVLAVLATSMLRYTATERRGNERNRLALRAKNLAENVAIYGAEQLTTKLYRLGSAPVMHFDWTGAGTNRIYPPPDGAVTSAFSSPSDIEIRAGILAASDYELVDDVTDPNNGLQVSIAKVPIIAKATVRHASLGTLTSYVQQDMEIALTPLFQFGMFYNMDLELYPSVSFTVAGPVHSNKRILAKPDGSAAIPITFLKRVTSAEGFYADASIKAFTRGSNGVQTTQDPTTGDVVIYKPNNTAGPSLKNSSNKWRDHKYTTSTETATTVSNFRQFATENYLGNFRTSAHGVTPLELPGIGTYKEADDPGTPEDDRNNGRQIIDPPNPQKWVYDSTIPGYTWKATTDDASTKESKIAYKAGLYIMVNPDRSSTPRSGTLPNGTTAYVLPHSYRAWLNYLDGSGVRQCVEIVLPGQPTYGYDAGADGALGTADDIMYRNYLPNRYTEQSAGGFGTGNQLLRIPQGGYGMGSNYQLNSAHATNATTLNLKSGTGPIMAGEVVTVGSFNYLVAADYPGGSGVLSIASPGLRAAASNNDPITLLPYGQYNVPGTPSYRFVANHASNATTLNLRVSTNATGAKLIPGSTITVGSHKYVITAASNGTPPNSTGTDYPVYIASPGLRAAVSASSGSPLGITIDTTSFNLGTGLGYRIDGGHSAGATSLTLKTGIGSGTILPGNTLFVGGSRYLVTSALNSNALTITPGLSAAVADDSVVIVDPYQSSGYSRSTAYPVANSGTTYPADSTAPYFPADAYFFDMRRANSNRGHTGYSGTTAYYNRAAVNYTPRAVAKIDFDMTRFRMMVNRVLGTTVIGGSTTTASIYDVRVPGSTGVTWSNSIYNNASSGVSRTSAGLGLPSGTTYTPASFTVLPQTTDANTQIRPDPYNIYYAPAAPEGASLNAILTSPMDYLVPSSILYNNSAPDVWYDGFAVYVHSVDAEKRAQTSGVPNRIDSGVRLWNGRGPVPSLVNTNGPVTGFTFVTNDAVYTVGHFNADGTINSTQNSTTNPGGYSAAYPDHADERLTAIMGDAYTALSHPTWTDATSGQASGWNDALSALAHATASSNWRTGSNSTSALSGNNDGVICGGIYPGLLPNQSYSGTVGSNKTVKLAAVPTEVSAALLMGIVPSNHDPRQLTDGFVPSTFQSTGTPAKEGNGVNSGGANNFPRLLEQWGSSTGLYIRGSIVALYESRVAMEPFTNSRCYGAPGRYWGLHYNFSQPKHDLPLEPIVIGSTRVGFRELSKAEYDTMKTKIEGL